MITTTTTTTTTTVTFEFSIYVICIIIRHFYNNICIPHRNSISTQNLIVEFMPQAYIVALFHIVRYRLLIAGLFVRQLVSKTPNHSRLRLSEAGSLFIDHVKSTDAGRYACRATSGSAADVTTRLTVYNASAKLVLQTVGSNFVSVTWQGLDSTVASTHYAILYRHRDEYHPKPSSTSGCFHAV